MRGREDPNTTISGPSSAVVPTMAHCGSVDVDLLFNVLPIVCGSSVFVFFFALLCVHSSFAIILKRKRKLVALLLADYCYYLIIVLHIL